MKQTGLAIGFGGLAVAILLAVSQDHTLAATGLETGWMVATALVLLVAAILILLTRFDRGSAALLRLDWFSPTLRRLKPGQFASQSLPGRLLRRITPRRWQSDRASKQRGVIRKSLRRLGLSWLASPLRRIVQTVCLLTFVVLFFYVCWPYNAQPAAAGRQSTDWTFLAIASQSSHLDFAGEFAGPWQPSPSDTVYVGGDSRPAQPFSVISVSPHQIRLQPQGELTAERLDAFVTADYRWTLSQTDPNAWPSHYADNLAAKEIIPAETFLVIDPLVSLSTAIASRSWVWSLASAAIILIVCILIPRGFCGYLCPLGTTIDLFDWAVGRRITRFRVPGDGWWVHIKYYLLAGTLLCAVFGVLVSGFFSAIPVITRGMLFLVDPLQSGLLRGWHLVPGFNIGQLFSIVLFLSVLGLGFFRPRFWCKYVCPSGAVFSLGNLFRATERKVESSCINCNKCVEICPFDAIKPDFTTRTSDCTMCQSCGGVCPTHAIKFVERWNVVELKVENDPPTGETAIGRRGFLSLAGGTAAAVAGSVGITAATKTFGARLDAPDAFLPVRPPGSVPEQEFLEMCIRCGECFKACPNNVLQPEAFQQGLEGLWTPMVNADWAGCESSCNACGQVCPTGAIRALPLAEKKAARMGLAIVNESTCLPFAGSEACDLCVQECNAAGYHAIEYTQVGTQVDDSGAPIEGTGYSAPVVLADKCVGCGLCQTRCNAINVKEKGLLTKSAIIVEAGPGKEDRLMSGSYIQLHELKAPPADSIQPSGEYFVPDAEDVPDTIDIPAGDDNPFGVPADPPAPSATVDDDPFGTLGL
ncbi:4Fe-4S binding protein [Stieleria sp. TO1_6]|uniref:4Fe-4S binding protein n=1 Tax=Stieleria tagensis TaxID=2956795 RepID=UPI00209B29D2|nr:4Fe-4S binding protein [Stieleria tagensis]MCO8121284.1 4Fe-4S binding protein [Stieleria tagensis]